MRKTTPFRANSVFAVIFFAVGTFISYGFYGQFRAYKWGLFTAALSCVLLIPTLRFRPNETSHLDAHGWTISATKGSAALFVTVASWSPQLLLTDLKTAVYNVFYFIVAGMTLGISLYFQDYVEPVKNYPNPAMRERALEMEHREVLAYLAFLGTAMLVLFVGLLGGYILGQFQMSAPEKSPVPLNNAVRYLTLGLFPALGYMLWILRPFHARAREIRIALKEPAARADI
jgi:hypothetical protein